MKAETPLSQDPWSRFARSFQARAGARWAWRALLACVGLAVLAPWLANERPYFARYRDTKGYEDALALIVPITEAVSAKASGAGREFVDELRALRARLALLEVALGSELNASGRAVLHEFSAQLDLQESAANQHDVDRTLELGDDLRELSARAMAVLSSSQVQLVARSGWPLLASLSMLDIAALCAWLGVATIGSWPRRVRTLRLRARLLVILLVALVAGGSWQLLLRPSADFDASVWKAAVAADPDARAIFAPIAFGPGETDLEHVLEAPLANGRGAQAHWCGTDALGRDLLTRMLFASRTSFSVALLAAALIVSVGSLLGLAAGTFRGVVDVVVSRAIELLAAFPTLVLLLGLVALLPVQLANSPWTMPLCIALFGWTQVARLARAEALKVSEMGFVQAAVASGFSRRHVLLRHVLPNSLGPVWIAASFVLSAGLVLESAAAFLGFGIQLPAPSFGALLADARATQAWWLALFPGLWLFASILAIHLVGEAVREALDPRDEAIRQ